MDTERASIRSPGVSGMFYPSEGRTLTSLIDNLHKEVKSQISSGTVTGNECKFVVKESLSRFNPYVGK